MESARPKKGDKIYVPGFLHITHGVDDFEGGVVTVGDVRIDKIGGQNVAFVYIVEDESWLNWDTFLAPMQDELRTHFGTKPGKPKPDLRPEFNDSSFSQPNTSRTAVLWTLVRQAGRRLFRNQ